LYTPALAQALTNDGAITITEVDIEHISRCNLSIPDDGECVRRLARHQYVRSGVLQSIID
jgi:hypothetical protein